MAGNLLIFNLKTDVDDSVLGFTTEWVNALARRFDRVFVLTVYMGRLSVADNVTVYSVGGEKGYSRARRTFEFYRILLGILLRHRIDACFAHMQQVFAVLGWPLLRLRGVPITLWYAHKAVPRSLRLANRVVDKVVTANADAYGLPGPKVRIVGHGIAERPVLAARAREGGDFVIVSMARLSRIKGLAELLRALGAPDPAPGAPRARLYLLGGVHTDSDKAYKAELQRLTREFGLEDRVHFVGNVPPAQLGEWLARADLGVNLSPPGAFDKAVLEYMAAGLPALLHNSAFEPLVREAGLDPEPWISPDLDPARLAAKIGYWRARTPEQDVAHLTALAAHVRAEHGIEGLAGRIAAELRATMEGR